MSRELREACSEALEAGELTDRMVTAAISVADGYLRRPSAPTLQKDDRDEYMGIFLEKLAKHWRRAAEADNVHAYTTTMAFSSLQTWFRSRSRVLNFDKILQESKRLARERSLFSSKADRIAGSLVDDWLEVEGEL